MALIEPLISPIIRGYTELYNKQKSLQRLKDGKKKMNSLDYEIFTGVNVLIVAILHARTKLRDV